MAHRTAFTRRTISPSIRITANDHDRQHVHLEERHSHFYQLPPANVGMPLEFRLGMREQQAEIDALVLNLNSNSKRARSSTICLPCCPATTTATHIVDARDYVVWRKTFGQSVTAWSGADGNGDTVVDATTTRFGSRTSVPAYLAAAVSAQQPRYRSRRPRCIDVHGSARHGLCQTRPAQSAVKS